MTDELIVDSFAGGGGASLGIFWALGRHPDVAINHDEAAIVMHAANHPKTAHYTEDIWKVNPRVVTGGRKVGLLWASPDCKHFSRAKGSKPVEKKIRSLAWVISKWADQSRPRLIILENVREFEDWGPLVPRWQCRECEWHGTEGQAILARSRRRCPRCESLRLEKTDDMIPDPSRKGLTFRRFVGRFRNLGYDVEWKVLNAADYGAPTHRRRLFLIARSDGQRIVWPEPTHGDPKKIQKPNLFPSVKPLKSWRTAAECIDWNLPCPSIFERKKPLAEATMNRIALGIKKYVLDAQEPFIVTCNHAGEHFRGQSLGQPFCTFAAARDAHGLVIPILSKYHGQFKDGKDSRCKSPSEPFNVLDTQNRFALVTAFLAKHFTGAVGSPMKAPIGTVTTQDHNALVTAFLAKTAYKKANGSYVNHPAEPFRTMTAQQDGASVIAANLVHLRRGPNPATGCEDPLRTVTAGGNHAFLVYSFLIKYFGTGVGQTLDVPLHTATTKDRFGLVIVKVNGEEYVIVDIGMRMLTPRELARGQGFPDSYILTGTHSSQVARIGNSVSPVMSETLVKANYPILKTAEAA